MSSTSLSGTGAQFRLQGDFKYHFWVGVLCDIPPWVFENHEQKICAEICLELVIIVSMRSSRLSHTFKSLCTPNKSKRHISQNRVTWIQSGCDLLHVFDVYMRNASGCVSEELRANCREPKPSVYADLLGNNVTPCFPSEKAVNRSTAPDSSSSAWQSTWCTGASASQPSDTHTHRKHTHAHRKHTLPHTAGLSFLTSVHYRWHFIFPSLSFTFVCSHFTNAPFSTSAYWLISVNVCSYETIVYLR